WTTGSDEVPLPNHRSGLRLGSAAVCAGRGRGGPRGSECWDNEISWRPNAARVSQGGGGGGTHHSRRRGTRFGQGRRALLLFRRSPGHARADCDVRSHAASGGVLSL